MIRFLSVAAVLICFGTSANPAAAGGAFGFSFSAFNAVQSSYSVNGMTTVGAMLTADFIETGPVGGMFFGAVGPTNNVLVFPPLLIEDNPLCLELIVPLVNGGPSFRCQVPTSLMTFGVPHPLVTITGNVCADANCAEIVGSRTDTFVAGVPEPTVLALVAIGLLGLGLARRRAIT